MSDSLVSSSTSNNRMGCSVPRVWCEYVNRRLAHAAHHHSTTAARSGNGYEDMLPHDAAAFNIGGEYARTQRIDARGCYRPDRRGRWRAAAENHHTTEIIGDAAGTGCQVVI